jgi:phosphate transport system protein
MQTFEGELQRLEDQLLLMSGDVEKALVASIDSLKRRDMSGSKQLSLSAQQIERKRFSIEADCLTLIVTQRPQDADLRALTAILEVATELERLAAYAVDITSIPLMVIEPPLVGLLADIESMATKVEDMLHRAMISFAQRDLAAARAIPSKVYEVDSLYGGLYRDLLNFMKNGTRTNGSRGIVNQARYLSRVTRNLRYAAEQIATICQWAVFATTGEMVERKPVAEPWERPESPEEAPRLPAGHIVPQP